MVVRHTGSGVAAAPAASGVSRYNPFAGLCDETTVELDAAALARVLARNCEEALEETRTFQIPEELLAIARGEDPSGDASGLPIELRRRSRYPESRRPAGARGLVVFAHVLANASAIALAYWIARLVQD